jgi:hypothetical protein
MELNSLVKLEPLTLNHKDELLPIVSNEYPMKYCANGIPWDLITLEHKIKQSDDDWKKPPGEQEGFYWIIRDLNNILIGFVGFHRVEKQFPYILYLVTNPPFSLEARHAFRAAITKISILQPDIKTCVTDISIKHNDAIGFYLSENFAIHCIGAYNNHRVVKRAVYIINKK